MSRYPRPLLFFINILPVSTTISKESNVKIERFCDLRGDIKFQENARVGNRSVLHGDVIVGRGTNLVEKVRVVGQVQFGNYCAIANNTLFQQVDHATSYPGMQRLLYDRVLDASLESTSSGPINIGSDVWIGANSIVLSGVDIGDGAVIGAGSVVTSDVEPYAIVAGVPAESIGFRFNKQVREALLEAEWWNWSEREMRHQKDFFLNEIDDVDDIPDI